MEYKIFIGDEFRKVYSNIPFNLKNDLKGFNIRFINKLSEEIAAELNRGFGRKDCIILQSKEIDKTRLILIVKIKLSIKNSSNNNEFRCICIVDQVNMWCIVLHVFGKNKKKDITNDEKKKINKLLNEYFEDLKKELSDE